jgi:shikimate kinase
MAGAGKTAVGEILSSKLSYNFLDSDKLIENLYGNSQEIIDTQGNERFKDIEEKVLLSIKFDKHVLATGGSAVFSHSSMKYLRECSEIIYLDVQFDTIFKRVGDFKGRGFVKSSDQTVKEAYEERASLYNLYADHIVDNNGPIEDCLSKILSLMDHL